MTDGPVARVLALALPGVPQALRGRPGPGTLAFLAWGLCVATVLWRWDRILAMPYATLDRWLGVIALLVVITLAWTWSLTSLQPAAAADGPAGWVDVTRGFSRNRLAVGGLVAIVLMYLIALLTPFLAPYDPLAQGDLMTTRFLPPGPRHLLGTDQFGRDVLSRLLYGARVSLSIGFIAVGISVSLGTVIGAVAGYLGGWMDGAIMRFVDMVIAFPRLVLLITIIALFEPSIFLIVAVLGLTQWPYVARIVRGEVLSLREREFVQAAEALGYGRRRIILRHVVPNALGPVIVAATLGIGNTIVLEAGLSFLGLGIQPPAPSWGNMVEDGRGVMLTAWWISTFPGLAIVTTVLAFNLVGDGLRDALDPRSRGG